MKHLTKQYGFVKVPSKVVEDSDGAIFPYPYGKYRTQSNLLV